MLSYISKWDRIASNLNNAQKVELNEAAKVKHNGLAFRLDGSKRWFNLVRVDPEPFCGDNPPPDEQQDWFTK